MVVQPKRLEITMRQFSVYAVATLAVAAFLAAAPAKAEYNYGPLKNGSQCWLGSPNQSGSNGSTWGYWGSCPAAASTTVAPRHHHHKV
jgi:hypothetical protein